MRSMEELVKLLENGEELWESELFRNGAEEIGKYAAAEVASLTPTVTGRLKRAWESRTEGSGKNLEVWVTNDVEYGPAVNYGHRIVRKGKTYGKTKGKHFLETGIYNYKRNHMGEDIKEMLKKLGDKLD